MSCYFGYFPRPRPPFKLDFIIENVYQVLCAILISKTNSGYYRQLHTYRGEVALNVNECEWMRPQYLNVSYIVHPPMYPHPTLCETSMSSAQSVCQSWGTESLFVNLHGAQLRARWDTTWAPLLSCCRSPSLSIPHWLIGWLIRVKDSWIHISLRSGYLWGVKIWLKRHQREL